MRVHEDHSSTISLPPTYAAMFSKEEARRRLSSQDPLITHSLPSSTTLGELCHHITDLMF